ncbi:MAG: choloylglycine hydrolase [Clostridia bacterium]|nr:choloylglycine hydrolase [Clostridia bacterium]
MCTAIGCNFNSFYFGRTLDLDCSYGEKVVITPRNFSLNFKSASVCPSHYAIIGMAAIIDNFPLYYDAANEKGLCMAGLRFSKNAYYSQKVTDRTNIAPFEFILWILCLCKSVKEARSLISELNIADIPFNAELPNAPLHWMIADKQEAITVEAVKEGIFVYDNKVGVLTNNPPFPLQLHRLNNYAFLTARESENLKIGSVQLEKYSLGLGALGLPGDFSSESRFVRAAFLKENSVCPKDEKDSVSQFFHILNAVNIPKGLVVLPDGKCHYTLYTSCVDAERGIYYYKPYENQTVKWIDMNRQDLESVSLLSFEV